MRLLPLFLVMFSAPAIAHDALVWGGPGACQDGCINGALHVTKLAGFDPMLVTPENFDPSIFETAKVWVQPGGKSSIASKSMGRKIREEIKKFIRDGGGYVGFCAGAFLTTPKVGTSSTEGLGIVPGKTQVYRKASGYPSIEAMTTPVGVKYHYWEGGPYFTFSGTPKVTITSRYQRTNQINGVETTYGEGKVAVTGTHPEAPQDWYDYANLQDQDGIDNEEAAAMIRKVAK